MAIDSRIPCSVRSRALPYDYVLGIDHQQRDFERFWGPSYLAGRYQDRGWWYYYLYALMVKRAHGDTSDGATGPL